ncbi:MAG: hypothetical protein HQL41_19670, partial [Alphaproteobacteria bacterium]|nr:hypothetical protein [Alphaproteobacteria bacterium]
WTARGGAACLSYRLRFEPGFAFRRGGKLPGLFGGDAPTGCAAAEGRPGFSARLMWREGGAGELYLYAPGRDSRCGESVARGAWTFVPGRWTRVVQEARPEEGLLRLWIDGDQVAALARPLGGDGRLGLLLHAFFGGSGESWASPRDQWLEIDDVGLWVQ